MDGELPRIRTPDQRIRVFVSSTLRELELEPERRAARAAIERMQLAPVMFELGARPHPPRELYRSYLAQSDIFVGVYWEKYGWVAPGENVSGLEDEYLLSGHLPSLIYIKDPADAREERLDGLLDRIRADDRSSYKSFRTADELAELLRTDLATLLAERFDASRETDRSDRGDRGDRGDRAPDAQAPHIVHAPDIPAPYTRLVGRTREAAEITALLDRPDVRIVSIVGPGGIGKSRLAIELATEAARAGRDVGFALLEAVSGPDRVIIAIARALGVRDAGGEGPLETKVAASIADRDVLLVVDNMEHVLDATPVLVRLVTECPRLQLLVTSRSPLRVRAERIFELGPLTLPEEGGGRDAAAAASAIELFVERAAAVRPGFALTPGNTEAVVEICRALDGVPLAIELAAARVRSLSPEEIRSRLGDALTLLVSGARDLPERQRALRSTIQWSVDLLPPDARAALSTLGVFAGTFALESAETVLSAVGVDDALEVIETLVDASLVSRTDQGSSPTFRLLALVRAYAAQLADDEAHDRAVAAWIAHYRAQAHRGARAIRSGDGQLDWLRRLDLEIENHARVTRTLFDRREFDEAADYMWTLYLFLWIGGYLGIVELWASELLQIIDREHTTVHARTEAIALYYRHAVLFWQDPDFDTSPGMIASRDRFHQADEPFGEALAGISLGLALLARKEGPDFPGAIEALQQSLVTFERIDDLWGQSMAHVMLGRIDLLAQQLDEAEQRFETSLSLARRQGERLAIVIALNHRGWAKLLGGDVDGGLADFEEAFDLSVSLAHDESIAYGLEAFAGVRAGRGDAWSAGVLVGAAQTIRRRKGFLNPGAFEFYMVALGALREAGRGEELDRAIADGARMSIAEALEYVRD